MNIKSIFARIGTCCGSSKEEKKKEVNQAVEDNSTPVKE
jgi:hypothetical protein